MSDVNPMLFQRVRENEDVIKVDHYKDISHVLEDVVNGGLEHSRSIGKSHLQDQELKGAVSHLESCLPLMSHCDANIVVASTEVKLDVDLFTAKLVKEVVTSGIRYQSL